ncbi:hypothetical protein JAAARDRAFT_34344 [Jaapia argillacea MUCL 33604]|uniref:SET domain-containing protein n=1 Tax=Jaapia argillacea MUCL 33604 TaxID=933084 RepID=A0A067PUZ1_9AGAM|nr:hypothetical protein JAAARDRAFT_34344 [Jaapia argillacea MUCL 33604]
MNDKPFTIQPLPHKGLGVIATRPIAQGEEILSESPLFTQSIARSAHTIARSLSLLTKHEQEQYLALSNCHQAQLPPLLGIFETNALPCGENNAELGLRADRAGIFLQASRFNSSCTPNVNNCWINSKKVISIHALRDIAEGEELYLCYTGMLDVRDKRRRLLKEKFGFDCHCEACGRVGKELKESDRRRQTIQRLIDEIPACHSLPADGVRKVKTALALLRSEGIALYEDTLSYDAFQFCVASSDFQSAKMWARKAYEAAILSGGVDYDGVEKFRKYMENPRSHMAAGMGRRMKLSPPDDV